MHPVDEQFPVLHGAVGVLQVEGAGPDGFHLRARQFNPRLIFFLHIVVVEGYTRSLLTGDWAWGASPLPGPREVLAKVRYRQTEQPALAEPLPDGQVRIDDPAVQIQNIPRGTGLSGIPLQEGPGPAKVRRGLSGWGHPQSLHRLQPALEIRSGAVKPLLLEEPDGHAGIYAATHCN